MRQKRTVFMDCADCEPDRLCDACAEDRKATEEKHAYWSRILSERDELRRKVSKLELLVRLFVRFDEATMSYKPTGTEGIDVRALESMRKP